MDVRIGYDETRRDKNFGGWCAGLWKCIIFPPIVRVICLSKAQKMSNETCCLFGWECVHIEAATPCVGGRLAATAYSNTHTLDDGQLQQQQ